MELTGLGVFAFLDTLSIAEAGAFAKRAGVLGYDALWLTEGPYGRDALVQAGYLLARTERIIIGTGVTSVWARGAAAMASAAWTNAEASGGRFALEIGINTPAVAAMRGANYSRPIGFMAEYVRALKAFKYSAAGSAATPPLVIGAQKPKMLELAGQTTDGAITYFATPAHTAEARRMLGAGKRLIVEQAVLMESDPSRARSCARNYMGYYLGSQATENFLPRWASIGAISPTGAAIGLSMRSSRGATRARSVHGSTSIAAPAPIRSASWRSIPPADCARTFVLSRRSLRPRAEAGRGQPTSPGIRIPDRSRVPLGLGAAARCA